MRLQYWSNRKAKRKFKISKGNTSFTLFENVFCSWYVLEHFTKNGMMNQKSSTFQTLSVVFVSYLEYTSPHEFCTPNIRPEKLYKLVWKLRIKKKPTLELILGLGWLLPWFGSVFSVLPNSIRKNFNHKKNERFNPNFSFRIGPKDIIIFPNNLWVYFVHFIYPLSFATFLCISFYAKEKPLRREFSEKFNPFRNKRRNYCSKWNYRSFSLTSQLKDVANWIFVGKIHSWSIKKYLDQTP